ncbi:MAG: hypothetical protein IE926_01900 [Micrococcales bacterium]|nr:hypothetical protein [Micrococcales bacterium]
MTVRSTVDFKKARRALRNATPEALDAAGRVVLDASNRLIPTDTGEMEKTGDVRVTGDTAAVFYTHPGAARQHERLDYHHDDGQAKFLEQASARTRAEQLAALAGEIRKELR